MYAFPQAKYRLSTYLISMCLSWGNSIAASYTQLKYNHSSTLISTRMALHKLEIWQSTFPTVGNSLDQSEIEPKLVVQAFK